MSHGKSRARFWQAVADLATRWPWGTPCLVPTDLYEGDVVGWYVTREGKPGLVVQQEGNFVCHLYGEARVHDCREDL